jgi:hypothetical protein
LFATNGKYIYTGGQQWWFMEIFQPPNYQTTNFYGFDGSGFSGAIADTILLTFTVCADTDFIGLQAWSISDPLNPTRISQIAIPLPSNLTVDAFQYMIIEGTHAYMLSQTQRICDVDISDIRSMRVRSFITPPPPFDSSGSGRKLAYTNGKLLSADRWGVLILDTAGDTLTRLASMVIGGDGVCDIITDGNYGYAAMGISGISIFDLHDLGAMNQVGALYPGGKITALEWKDRALYAARQSDNADSAGFLVYSSPAPGTLERDGFIKTPLKPYDIRIQENRAYVFSYIYQPATTYDGFVSIYDINDHYHPRLITNLPVRLCEKIYLKDSLLFVYLPSGADTGYVIYDVADTNNIHVLYRGTRQPHAIVGKDSIFYRNLGSSSPITIDVMSLSNPQEPNVIGSFSYPSDYPWMTMAIHENHLFVSSDSSLFVFDISNERNPVLQYTVSDIAGASKFRFAGDTVFICAEGTGLWVARCDTSKTGIKYQPPTPGMAFELSQNYPNPFNPSTRISFSIATESFTELTVYNSVGQKVRDVLSGRLPAGKYSVAFDGSGLPSGTYFYSLITGQYRMAKKMILVK